MASARPTSSFTNFASVWNVFSLLAADRRQGVHRRPADDALGIFAADLVCVAETGRRRLLRLREDDRLVVLRQHLERVAVQPVAEPAVGAVVDRRSTRSGLRRRDRLPTRDWSRSPRCASGRRRRTCRSCCRRWPGSRRRRWLWSTASPCPCGRRCGRRCRPRPRPASASCSCRAARCGRNGPADRLARRPGRPALSADACSSGSIFGYMPARRPASAISGIAETRSASDGTDFRPSAHALSTLPSELMRATKPIWRMTACFADRARFSMSARTSANSLGTAACQQTHQVEDDAFVAVLPLVVDQVDRVDQDAQLAAGSFFARSRSASRRNSSRTPGRKSSSRSTARVRSILMSLFERDVAQEVARAGVGGELDVLALRQRRLEDRIQRLERLAAEEVEVLVGRLFRGDEDHLDGLRDREKLAARTASSRTRGASSPASFFSNSSAPGTRSRQ